MYKTLKTLNGFKWHASWIVVFTVFSLSGALSMSWAQNETPLSSDAKPVESKIPAVDEINIEQIKAARAAAEGSQDLGES